MWHCASIWLLYCALCSAYVPHGLTVQEARRDTLLTERSTEHAQLSSLPPPSTLTSSIGWVGPSSELSEFGSELKALGDTDGLDHSSSSNDADDYYLLAAYEGSNLGKRQAGGASFVSASGTISNDCGSAPLYRIVNGSLAVLVDGLTYTYSTNTSTGNQLFIPSTTVGSINTTFYMAGSNIAWSNSAFYGGQAQFCADSTGKVYAVFSQYGFPSGCFIVQLQLFAASSCWSVQDQIDQLKSQVSSIQRNTVTVVDRQVVTEIQPASTETTTAPAETETPPTVTQTPPAITQTPPAVTNTPPAVTRTPPAVTRTPPAVTNTPPAVTQTPPAATNTVTNTPPTVTNTPPAVTQTPPASTNTVTNTPPAVTQTPPAVTNTPPAVTNTPPAQTTTRTVTATTSFYIQLPTPSSCGNQGFQYAVFNNNQPPHANGNVYSLYDPTYIKARGSPGSNSTWSTIYYNSTVNGIGGYASGCSGNTNPQISLYSNAPSTISCQMWSADYRGYFYVYASGTWSFSASGVDDAFVLWLGPLAQQGWTKQNANLSLAFGYNTGYGIGTFTTTLTAGTYLPMRIVHGQATGGYGYSLTIVDPNGVAAQSSASRDSGYVVQYSCDGTSAPRYAYNFGQEQ